MAFGMLSLAGDALSSAVKRRLHAAPGTELPGVDQLPEALLPMLALASPLHLTPGAVLAVAATFLAADVLVAPLRARRQ
jgi:hypothetical protein